MKVLLLLTTLNIIIIIYNYYYYYFNYFKGAFLPNEKKVKIYDFSKLTVGVNCFFEKSDVVEYILKHGFEATTTITEKNTKPQTTTRQKATASVPAIKAAVTTTTATTTTTTNKKRNISDVVGIDNSVNFIKNRSPTKPLRRLLLLLIMRLLLLMFLFMLL